VLSSVRNDNNNIPIRRFIGQSEFAVESGDGVNKCKNNNMAILLWPLRCLGLSEFAVDTGDGC